VNLVSADEAAGATADHEVVEQVTILQAARARRDAVELADRGDFEGATALLSLQASRLRFIGSDDATSDAELLDEHTTHLAQSRYDASRRKRLTDEAWRSTRGRRTHRPREGRS
jgi:Ca-activated chloride channel family protein